MSEPGQPNQPSVPQQEAAPEHPLAALTDAGLEALLHRAIRITLILGGLAAVVVGFSTGWRNAAMLAAGTAVSAASITEWRRLVRIINAQMDRKQTPRGAAVAAVFFVLRLTVFAAVIYVSLKCFRGSVAALLGGLGLAVVAMAWEAIGLLLGTRD
jgi:uncharacterized membrane protein